MRTFREVRPLPACRGILRRRSGLRLLIVRRSTAVRPADLSEPSLRAIECSARTRGSVFARQTGLVRTRVELRTRPEHRYIPVSGRADVWRHRHHMLSGGRVLQWRLRGSAADVRHRQYSDWALRGGMRRRRWRADGARALLRRTGGPRRAVRRSRQFLYLQHGQRTMRQGARHSGRIRLHTWWVLPAESKRSGMHHAHFWRPPVLPVQRDGAMPAVTKDKDQRSWRPKAARDVCTRIRREHACASLRVLPGRVVGLARIDPSIRECHTLAICLPGAESSARTAQRLRVLLAGMLCMLVVACSTAVAGSDADASMMNDAVSDGSEGDRPTLRAVEVVAGLNPPHTCVRVTDGTVLCWGDNQAGQLGTGSDAGSPLPQRVVGLSNVSGIAVCVGRTCAVLHDGTVRCWGANRTGGLGDGTLTASSTPVPVVGLANATSVACGRDHGCARINDGTVRCWGGNAEGQLGNGTASNSLVPIPVDGLTDVAEITCGLLHTCARLGDGSVRCWGNNAIGELGDGSTTTRRLPTRVASIDSAVEIDALSVHTCARLANGAVRCWGENGGGQLGDGTTTDRPMAVSVIGLPLATSISTGTGHTCARTIDRETWCWGSNGFGQTGDQTTVNRHVPVRATMADGALQVSAGNLYTCIRTATSGVLCWGRNIEGQLGDGTMTTVSFSGVAVVGLEP